MNDPLLINSKPSKRRKARTEIATKASRANGKLGGRPPRGSTHAPGEWKPGCQRLEVQAGVERVETEDEAWKRVRRVVQHYAAIGYPSEVICRLVEPPCCQDTLRKHFKFELENGRFIADARMAGTVYQLGVSGRDPASARFWTRCRLGWRDRGDTPTGVLEVKFTPIPGDDW